MYKLSISFKKSYIIKIKPDYNHKLNLLNCLRNIIIILLIELIIYLKIIKDIFLLIYHRNHFK